MCITGSFFAILEMCITGSFFQILIMCITGNFSEILEMCMGVSFLKQNKHPQNFFRLRRVRQEKSPKSVWN